MSRFVAILVLAIVIVFTLVIGSYYLLTSESRYRDSKRSERSKEHRYPGIQPARAFNPNLKQTKYIHIVSASGGRGHLINQPKECKIWSGADRVHGGTNAEIGEFPFIALLEYLYHDTYSFECGGSLINQRYVITAAHCLFAKNLVNIRLGEYDLSKDIDTDEEGDPLPEPINVGYENIIIHQYYSKDNSANDIGLIQLSMDIEYKVYLIQPICIPDSSMDDAPDDDIALVAGWGNTGHEKNSMILQRVGVPIFNAEKCQEKFSPTKILPSQLCAGGKKGQDACLYDSGGPLVTRYTVNNIKKSVLEGVVSYGQGCGSDGVPGVYTRISYYYDWILQNLKP